MPKVAELIRMRVELQPVGQAFTPNAFLDCGKRASGDQTLSRLVELRLAIADLALPKV